MMAVLSCLFAVTSASAPAYGETLKISGTGGALGALKVLAREFQKFHPDVKFTFLPSLGSSGAIKAVLAGALDIGVSGRTLEEEEIRQGGVAVQYAMTPFVFGVGEKTKASGVTLAQLVDIYAGRIKTWPDGGQIRVVLRPEAETDTTILRKISTEMDRAVRDALSREGMMIAMTDQDSADAIEKLPGAIGTLTLTQILSEERRIQPLALNGVVPSVEVLANGSYPYLKPYFLVTGPKASDRAKQFVDFVRSAEARKILMKLGLWVPPERSR